MSVGSVSCSSKNYKGERHFKTNTQEIEKSIFRICFFFLEIKVFSVKLINFALEILFPFPEDELILTVLIFQESGHLSYACPHNLLGEREPPPKKVKKRKNHEMEEE